ncbi:LON peptidase substrate-binding domain-containing protein [Acidiferrimicrobium sp. IK]|uniref:LON peptidase substrate-binding domain-containing protein n=1 Tax=Acidiferrimicrobium sp. IK TaxID=2871700 RepID=UPI0021CB0A2E|nr:LON peptidase substrate-binding domain-containing protein [Acidiferrimicrobium sp. IK]MCU4184649.1 LON peptidase substrate-binding domain-containing protein [Acidiferrimicrobium sp. IK]
MTERRLPMFPLGTVLVPGAVLPLHVFEPRYRALMDDLTGAELGTPLIEPEFGVVMIERGHEVGGGDVRAARGTTARLIDAERLPDGRWLTAAVGTNRFVVREWLPDDPYPMAVVEDIDEPPWDDGDDGRLAAAATALRRLLGLAAELEEDVTPATFDLADDPAVAAWQLCALAPVGPLDRYRLLEAPDVASRLDALTDMTADIVAVLALRLRGG